MLIFFLILQVKYLQFFHNKLHFIHVHHYDKFFLFLMNNELLKIVIFLNWYFYIINQYLIIMVIMKNLYLLVIIL